MSSMYVHSMLSAPKITHDSMQRFRRIFCPTSNWLVMRSAFTSCTTRIVRTLIYYWCTYSSHELHFRKWLMLLLCSSIGNVDVVVVIAYRSHLIERTEESFIHLIWPEIFFFVCVFFCRWCLLFSSFVATIGIVARWKESTDTLQTLDAAVHCGSLSFITDEILLELDCRIPFAFGWPHVFIRCTRLRFFPQSTTASTDKPSAFFNLFHAIPLSPSLSLNLKPPRSLHVHRSQNRSQCVFFPRRPLCIWAQFLILDVYITFWVPFRVDGGAIPTKSLCKHFFFSLTTMIHHQFGSQCVDK